MKSNVAIFNNIVVENPSRMTHRRIYEHIGIRYADIGRMEQIVADVRQMLQGHEDIDQDQTLMVFFDRCSPSSVGRRVKQCFFLLRIPAGGRGEEGFWEEKLVFSAA